MNSKALLNIWSRCNNIKYLSRSFRKSAFSTNNKNNSQSDADIQQTEREFMQQGNRDYSNIQLNPESIKKKQTESSKNINLSVDNYKIKKPSQFYDPKMNPNPTGHVFSFHEEVLLQKTK